jgi:hypothetical protein
LVQASPGFVSNADNLIVLAMIWSRVENANGPAVTRILPVAVISKYRFWFILMGSLSQTPEESVVPSATVCCPLGTSNL